MTSVAERGPIGGLSAPEAARRLAEYGANAIGGTPPVPLWRRLVQQLRDPLILVLLGAAALTIATGDVPDSVIILIVVVVNTAVGVAQELRAERAVAALTEMSAPHARVVRDGAELAVPAGEVVPGDALLVGEGDVIAADARLLGGPGMLVDESALTGESVPVTKAAASAEAEERELHAGTVVVRGRGEAVVTATGARSSLGRIAALLDPRPRPTPLQRRLAELGRLLAGGVLALCAIVLGIGLLNGEPVERMVITSISLAVAAVPESLPAVVTLALALGARRMAHRQAIVRRLPAVETLGSVSVLATDKTGTLTEGRMSVAEIWTPGFTAHRDSSVPRSFSTDAGPLTDPQRAALVELLLISALCNDATLPDDGGPALGDPTEVALLEAAAALGISRSAVERVHPRIDEVPFDSTRKRMTTIHATGNELLVCTKGAWDSLRAADAVTRASQGADTAAAQLAARGLRVLAIATARRPTTAAESDMERGLRLLGLVGMVDQPRLSAASTVAACRAAGIRPVMITGDHPATARAIAGEVGILTDADGPDAVALGAELTSGAIDPKPVRVYARVTPEQKLDIVRQCQQGGAVVAMTGDGVNDAPALRRADIGVAMGERGTEVARQAADLVLADDELGTVVAAVEEGRRVYDNVRRFLRYALAGGSAEILIMLLGPAIGLDLPLLAGQILWINLLTHGLTGVAMGAEPPAQGSMRRPPRSAQQSILGARLWQSTLVLGAVITVVSLGVGWWLHHAGGPWQSTLFLTLTFLQLGVALGSRARPGTRSNPFLPVTVLICAGLALAAVYLAPLRSLLSTTTVAPRYLGVVMAAGVVGWAAVHVLRRVRMIH